MSNFGEYSTDGDDYYPGSDDDEHTLAREFADQMNAPTDHIPDLDDVPGNDLGEDSLMASYSFGYEQRADFQLEVIRRLLDGDRFRIIEGDAGTFKVSGGQLVLEDTATGFWLGVNV